MKNLYLAFDFVFVSLSGLFYTVERFGNYIFHGDIQNGVAVNQGVINTDVIPKIKLSENPYVLPFLYLGVILVAIGVSIDFYKWNANKRNFKN